MKKVTELKLDVIGENEQGEQKHVVIVCHDVDHYDHESDSVAVLKTIGEAVLAKSVDAGKVEIFANEEGPSDLDPGVAIASDEFDKNFGIVLRGASQAAELQQQLSTATQQLSAANAKIAGLTADLAQAKATAPPTQ